MEKLFFERIITIPSCLFSEEKTFCMEYSNDTERAGCNEMKWKFVNYQTRLVASKAKKVDEIKIKKKKKNGKNKCGNMILNI